MLRTFFRALVWNFAKWLFFRHSTDKTNATFFRKGTKQRNDKDLRPARWHWLPGWQRLCWKLGIVLGVPAVAWWWISLTHDAAAVLVLFIVLIVGNVVVFAAKERWKGRKHDRAVVEPLQAAVDRVFRSAA